MASGYWTPCSPVKRGQGTQLLGLPSPWQYEVSLQEKSRTQVLGCRVRPARHPTPWCQNGADESGLAAIESARMSALAHALPPNAQLPATDDHTQCHCSAKGQVLRSPNTVGRH
jgi:hypothetical protein